MKTIIFKWNPAFSSYTILQFLKDLHEAYERDEEERSSNWSVRDYDKVHAGDRFYMLKVGYGQTGIVARGTVTSDAYMGEDWSFNNRPRYYVDYVPDFMINPDGFKLLTSDELSHGIPNFEWFGGHSGIVLSEEDAAKLEEMWAEYIATNSEAFDRASDDNLFMANDERGENQVYTIEYSRDYDDELQLDIEARTPYFDKTLRRRIEIEDGARTMKTFKVGSKRLLTRTIHQLYPTPDDLGRLCADLFSAGINFRTRVHLLDDNDSD